MSIRVTSGIARGRRLKDVPGDYTRPVTDIVKQALFNIIASDVIDSTWWDVFAGTGAIGIEALSRGAKFVRFSDLHKPPIDTIKYNLNSTGFTNQSEIIQADAFGLFTRKTDLKFDYIYIAPPQYKEMWNKSLFLLDSNVELLFDGGWVVVQIHPREEHGINLENLTKIDQRKYGSTLLIFFEKT